MRTFTLHILFFMMTLCGVAQDKTSKTDPKKDTPEKWSIGVEGGYTRNYLITNISSLPFSQLRPAGGYCAGINAQYQWNSWFAICADPGVVQKNYEFIRTGFFQGTRQWQNNSYLQLPLMARFSVGGKKLRGFFNLGGYGAYWAAGSVRGTLPDLLDPTSSSSAATVFNFANPYSFRQPYEFNSKRDNRLEWGWIAGAGISWQVDHRVLVFIEGRNTHSLTDQQKAYQMQQVPKYNQTYGAILGVMVNVHEMFRKADKKEPATTNK